LNREALAIRLPSIGDDDPIAGISNAEGFRDRTTGASTLVAGCGDRAAAAIVAKHVVDEDIAGGNGRADNKNTANKEYYEPEHMDRS
jgi:hypothetical protein